MRERKPLGRVYGGTQFWISGAATEPKREFSP
jgi:hypothetical protein